MNILPQFFESTKRKKKPANLEVYIQQKMSFQTKSKLRIFFFQIMKTENFPLPHLPHYQKSFSIPG